MVEEIFMLEVKPGTERSFENTFNESTNIMRQAEGFLGAELRGCIEQENKYLVTVSWNVEAHVDGFKNSAAFQEMKALLSPFYLNLPQVEHYKYVK